MKKTSYSQFYNYAKGMYQESKDVWEDMKQLVSDRSMIETQFVSECDIVSILLDAVFQLEPNPVKIRVYIEDFSPMNYYKWVEGGIQYIGKPHPDYDYNYAVLSKSLSILRQSKVFDTDDDGNRTPLIDIDKPNDSIMELSKFGKEQFNAD
jgi:hypothetical protein